MLEISYNPLNPQIQLMECKHVSSASCVGASRALALLVILCLRRLIPGVTADAWPRAPHTGPSLLLSLLVPELGEDGWTSSSSVALLLFWAEQIKHGQGECEVLFICQQYRATACAAKPWFDLRGRFFVEVWSFLCFDGLPDLCFALGLEMKREGQHYITQLQATFSASNLHLKPGFTLLEDNWNFQHKTCLARKEKRSSC